MWYIVYTCKHTNHGIKHIIISPTIEYRRNTGGTTFNVVLLLTDSVFVVHS